MGKRGTVYNNIVTQELWIEVSEDNKSLMNEFIEYMKSVNKSETTIKAYTEDLRIFWVWNLQHNDNKFFINFTKRDIMKYQNYLIHTLKHSPNRVRRLKAVISSMSNFIESVLDEDYPDFKNIVNKIPAPAKEDVREKTVFTEEQLQKLLDDLVAKEKYQQACALALAIASGARKAELLRFKVSFFVDENIKFNSLYKTPEKIKTKGRGNGKMLVKWVLVKQFKPYFDLWMKQREELGINGEELFWTKNKQDNSWIPATITTLNSYAETFTNMLGIDFYFHSCRHYFCTSLCQANIPASVIKDVIGWDNVSMIDTYNDTEVDDEIGKYFNEDGIKVQEIKGLNEI